jgi:glutamyl-tRNA reductase
VTDSGIISGIRVTYRQADVDSLAAAGGQDVRSDVNGLLARNGVREAFVLRTCNRVEAYVVTDDRQTGRSALQEFLADVEVDVVETSHERSLRHLMRVAAGLESMVLGEDRVLGQVKDAYEHARGVGGIGPVFEEAIPKAIHVGERVRTETEINDGVVSMESAAAEWLDERADLTRATGLVVGTGDVGTGAAKALVARGVEELLVANRTVSAAESLVDALNVNGNADTDSVGLDDLERAIERANVVVTATGASDPLVDPDLVSGTGQTWIVDMGQPRDVRPDVEEVPGVECLDLDAIEALTDDTRDSRREAADLATAMIDREFDHLLDRFKRKRADSVIAAMHEGAERVKNRELRTALRKLEAEGELTDDQREVVESLADTLVSQLLAAPTKSLRDAAAEDDWTTIATALQLFDPDFGADPPEFVPDDAAEAAGGQPGTGTGSSVTEDS